jgi:hypothetical protein
MIGLLEGAKDVVGSRDEQVFLRWSDLITTVLEVFQTETIVHSTQYAPHRPIPRDMYCWIPYPNNFDEPIESRV